jgi:hypothetical protein
MENTKIDPSQVKGWGVDADPSNEPTYPMRHRVEGEHDGYSWERPAQQSETVEVLQSNERPNLSAVFGTSTPPAGLSGMIRRFAFKYSESSYGHWLPLMMADRVGVVEGILADLSHGHIPNIFDELGLKAELKHNRKEFLTRSLTIAALGTAAFLAYRKGKREGLEILD